MSKYLDNTGLAYFWGKVKNYVDTHAGGGGASSIAEISQTYATNGGTTYAITNYNHGADALQVYLNGLKLIKGTDWQLSANNANVVLTNAIAAGNVLEIVTLRIA